MFIFGIPECCAVSPLSTTERGIHTAYHITIHRNSGKYIVVGQYSLPYYRPSLSPHSIRAPVPRFDTRLDVRWQPLQCFSSFYQRNLDFDYSIWSSGVSIVASVGARMSANDAHRALIAVKLAVTNGKVLKHPLETSA